MPFIADFRKASDQTTLPMVYDDTLINNNIFMKFQGRIKKLLLTRQGVSQRTGNEWMALPFIFEYFENPNDRYADEVLLETFDTNIIQHLKEGMEVIIGFGHRVREFTPTTGDRAGQTQYINDLRIYSMQSVQKAQAQQDGTNGTTATSPAPQPAEGEQADDLPF